MAMEPLINAIARLPWIEAIAQPLQQFVRSAFPGDGGREIKNALHGTWLGHPLHPVLTDIPVGAWTVAAVLDAVELATGNTQASTAADAAVAIGLAGAVGSAITGLTDWSETDGRGRNVGVMHAVLNVVATTLYASSFLMRRKAGTRQTGIALSMMGYAISGSAAYLGGHLVFGEQIGVDHTATSDNTKPEEFTAVMATSDLRENKPARVLAEGVAIMLLKRGERIFALSDTCPHLGGPLSEGKIVGDAIQCPWHQSELALEDGHVVNGPTTFPARCFDVRVRSGQIEVRAGNKHAEA